jgi:hypothetical protein
MNDKFKNFLVLVFCNEIVWGDFGTTQYIKSVEQIQYIDDVFFTVVTDVETIEINEHQYNLINEHIDKELSEAHDEAMQRAYFEDQNSGVLRLSKRF